VLSIKVESWRNFREQIEKKYKDRPSHLRCSKQQPEGRDSQHIEWACSWGGLAEKWGHRGRQWGRTYSWDSRHHSPHLFPATPSLGEAETENNWRCTLSPTGQWHWTCQDSSAILFKIPSYTTTILYTTWNRLHMKCDQEQRCVFSPLPAIEGEQVLVLVTIHSCIWDTTYQPVIHEAKGLHFRPASSPLQKYSPPDVGKSEQICIQIMKIWRLVSGTSDSTLPWSDHPERPLERKCIPRPWRNPETSWRSQW
jgi:hypothetical protein